MFPEHAAGILTGRCPYQSFVIINPVADTDRIRYAGRAGPRGRLDHIDFPVPVHAVQVHPAVVKSQSLRNAKHLLFNCFLQLVRPLPGYIMADRKGRIPFPHHIAERQAEGKLSPGNHCFRPEHLSLKEFLHDAEVFPAGIQGSVKAGKRFLFTVRPENPFASHQIHSLQDYGKMKMRQSLLQLLLIGNQGIGSRIDAVPHIGFLFHRFIAGSLRPEYSGPWQAEFPADVSLGTDSDVHAAGSDAVNLLIPRRFQNSLRIRNIRINNPVRLGKTGVISGNADGERFIAQPFRRADQGNLGITCSQYHDLSDILTHYHGFLIVCTLLSRLNTRKSALRSHEKAAFNCLPTELYSSQSRRRYSRPGWRGYRFPPPLP